MIDYICGEEYICGKVYICGRNKFPYQSDYTFPDHSNLSRQFEIVIPFFFLRQGEGPKYDTQ